MTGTGANLQFPNELPSPTLTAPISKSTPASHCTNTRIKYINTNTQIQMSFHLQILRLPSQHQHFELRSQRHTTWSSKQWQWHNQQSQARNKQGSLSRFICYFIQEKFWNNVLLSTRRSFQKSTDEARGCRGILCDRTGWVVFDGRCTRLADIFKCILIKQTIWNLIHAPVHLSKVIHGNEMKSSPLCSLLGNVLRDIKCNPVCWIGSIVVHFIQY